MTLLLWKKLKGPTKSIFVYLCGLRVHIYFIKHENLWDAKKIKLKFKKSGFVSCIMHLRMQFLPHPSPHCEIKLKDSALRMIIQMYSVNKGQTQWGTFHRASQRTKAWPLSPDDTEIELHTAFTHTDCMIHSDLLFAKLLHVYYIIWSSQQPYNGDTVSLLPPFNGWWI